jgi:GNAT superfamily N-acetyltransferase
VNRVVAPPIVAANGRVRETPRMSDELPRLRSLFGQSTARWAGVSGVRGEPGRWLALSGACGVNYNVALCHEASRGEAIRDSIQEINARRMPGLIMIAAEALRDVQHLVSAGWVCVGATPFMGRELNPDEGPVETDAYRVGAGEMAAVQDLVSRVYSIAPDMARVALPDAALTTPNHSVWAVRDVAGELVSCLGAATVEDTVVVWSMATSVPHRRRGYGSALLTGVLRDAARANASFAVLSSSTDGEPLYESMGYRVLEHWQLWSRPRWVLGQV